MTMKARMFFNKFYGLKESTKLAHNWSVHMEDKLTSYLQNGVVNYDRNRLIEEEVIVEDYDWIKKPNGSTFITPTFFLKN